MQVENSRPAILCFAGLDPSGGAGLQADIEAIAACGGHALPIATCLTVQTAVKASANQIIDAKFVQQQAEALLADMPIAACKIGVIPNAEMAITIAGILSQLPDIPIVYDPVLHATEGISFCDLDTIDKIKKLLLPYVNIITPNQAELQQLTLSHTTETENAHSLCLTGTNYVLVTGADQAELEITNTLYNENGIVTQHVWQKLPHSYHGSGCTLSSALACYLALGNNIQEAVFRAQEYTWQTLQQAHAIGAGQYLPKRI